MTDAPLTYFLGRVSVPAHWTAYRIHQHLWKGWPRPPGTPQPFTFRRLTTSHRGENSKQVTVLVQSAEPPVREALDLRAEDCRTGVVPSAGQRVGLGVLLQAIVRSSGKAAGVKRHQRTIKDPAERDQWILTKLGQAGLSVDSFWSRQHAFETPVGEQTLKTEATWVEGEAVVTDPQALIRALSQGVGRGRSVGLGLLSLMRTGG